MRKPIIRKRKAYEEALQGYGVVIDEQNGKIYRLCLAPDGWCRVCQNDFDAATNTVLGAATHCWDYATPEEALYQFSAIKNLPGITWRADDRVLYDPMKNEEKGEATCLF